MKNTLRVINPFFTVNTGDIFEFCEDTKMYVSKRSESFYENGDDDDISDIKSSYSAEFSISPDYARTLIDEGYLEEIDDNKQKFVNIFDEIDNLLNKYNQGLKDLEKDTIGLPTCVKVERETVLTNMVTLLEHLKSLKK